MKFDNRKNVYKIWLRKFFQTLILVLLVIVIGFSDLFRDPVLGLDKSVYLIAIGIIYIIIIIVNALLKPDFVFYGDMGDKIIMRYYPVRIFNRKKNSIEINKSRFTRYDTEKFFFGLKEKLYLYQKTPHGTAKYPGISLSAVNKEDVRRIKAALDQYVRKN